MRKLIDFYPELIVEAGAGEEAKKRGLKSIGFGRYADPATGKVVAKSENGRLVAVKGSDDVGAAVSKVKDIEKRNKGPMSQSELQSNLDYWMQQAPSGPEKWKKIRQLRKRIQQMGHNPDAPTT